VAARVCGIWSDSPSFTTPCSPRRWAWSCDGRHQILRSAISCNRWTWQPSAVIRDWTIAQILVGVAGLADGQAQRSGVQHDLGNESRAANGENHGRAWLRQLLGELDLEGVLIQADALHTHRPFFGSSSSEWPTSC
jgi:hypothetical protein